MGAYYLEATQPTAQEAKGVALLRLYAQFSDKLRAAHPTVGRYIPTEHGWVGTSEVHAHMYLCHLRAASHNSARTLDNKWALLRAAIRVLPLPVEEMPAWVLRGHGGSAKHHALFRKWKLEDAGSALSAPPKGHLTPTHIEQFCLLVISKHLTGELADDSVELLWALVLRLQSGCGGRHQNIGDLKWKDCRRQRSHTAEVGVIAPSVCIPSWQACRVFWAYSGLLACLTRCMSATACKPPTKVVGSSPPIDRTSR